MGIYDQRDKPAYERFRAEPEYAANSHILRWWTPAYDRLLKEQIRLWQWAWYWHVVDEIVKIIPPVKLKTWRRRDPACSIYAWYNVLMYFTVARADQLGLIKAIRSPKRKICPLCNKKFLENSVPDPLIERMGISQIDFCAPCLRDTILQSSGSDSVSKKGILQYLRKLAAFLQKVPTQNFGEGPTDLQGLDTRKRLALLRLLRKKPTSRLVKKAFGSWLNALIQAKLLEDGTRKTMYGIQTVAKDGHVCLSLAEKTIDDFLHAHGIRHEKEPRYPDGNYRADFRVKKSFIEYFGLAGNLDYDTKTKEKIRICREHRLRLIALYPADLSEVNGLAEKLSTLL